MSQARPCCVCLGGLYGQWLAVAEMRSLCFAHAMAWSFQVSLNLVRTLTDTPPHHASLRTHRWGRYLGLVLLTLSSRSGCNDNKEILEYLWRHHHVAIAPDPPWKRSDLVVASRRRLGSNLAARHDALGH